MKNNSVLIRHYAIVCDAFVLLMQPLVEVVMHDLKTGIICYIGGSLSSRSVGEPSLIDGEKLSSEIGSTTYLKLAMDGRPLKSVSILLTDDLLLCINCDISVFEEMRAVAERFMQVNDAGKPESLFKNDWQERLHVAVASFLRERSLRLDELSGKSKKELVRHLYESGAFNEKNAADYVAKALDMGRATIFNYLREWKGGR